MTTIAVLCDPPRPGLVLPNLVETSPLTEREAADLYVAMLGDVVRAVTGSGGDLLVNYRPDESLPETHQTGADAEEAVREAVTAALDDPGDARFERQVGQTFAGRAGNTVTHLLEQEGVSTAAIVEPTAAFLTRGEVDNAAMKLRRSEVVLGPAIGGRVYYAAFADTVDFADAYAPPAIETLTDRAVDAGLGVDFLPSLPVVRTGPDLASALALLGARRRADLPVPPSTAARLDDLGLDVVDDGGLTLVR